MISLKKIFGSLFVILFLSFNVLIKPEITGNDAGNVYLEVINNSSKQADFNLIYFCLDCRDSGQIDVGMKVNFKIRNIYKTFSCEGNVVKKILGISFLFKQGDVADLCSNGVYLGHVCNLNSQQSCFFLKTISVDPIRLDYCSWDYSFLADTDDLVQFQTNKEDGKVEIFLVRLILNDDESDGLTMHVWKKNADIGSDDVVW